MTSGSGSLGEAAGPCPASPRDSGNGTWVVPESHMLPSGPVSGVTGLAAGAASPHRVILTVKPGVCPSAPACRQMEQHPPGLEKIMSLKLGPSFLLIQRLQHQGLQWGHSGNGTSGPRCRAWPAGAHCCLGSRRTPPGSASRRARKKVQTEGDCPAPPNPGGCHPQPTP